MLRDLTAWNGRGHGVSVVLLAPEITVTGTHPPQRLRARYLIVPHIVRSFEQPTPYGQRLTCALRGRLLSCKEGASNVVSGSPCGMHSGRQRDDPTSRGAPFTARVNTR